MRASVDLGITNVDVALRRSSRLEFSHRATTHQPVQDQLSSVLATLEYPADPVDRVAVTGGRYRSLPDTLGPIQLVKISEIEAIGRGGLFLSGLDQALVVSAGSGTAMVAARPDACAHVTGSAVGGGTLQGLASLLLGTNDALEIDRLAMLGDANHADLTLVEAVGDRVGRLPSDANAVNFGRLARETIDLSPADRAAGLVRLVGQVIAVIAINAARAEALETVVFIGHLVDLPSVRKVLTEVAGYYAADIRVPANPGAGTALGALLSIEK
jgi:type II pantothenate kinase